MNYYIGTKLIKAESMTRGEYNKFRNWELPKGEDRTIDGYKIQYEDGYVSWCPGRMFKKQYLKVDDNSKLPSGHVIQWGVAQNVTYAGIYLTLPLAYKTVLTAQASTSRGEYAAGADFVSTSQLRIFNPISSVLIPYVYWMTIGVI